MFVNHYLMFNHRFQPFYISLIVSHHCSPSPRMLSAACRAKAYLWLRDDLEPLHLARFGTPSQREEVPDGRKPWENRGEQNPIGSLGWWLFFQQNGFRVLGIHSRYMLRDIFWMSDITMTFWDVIYKNVDVQRTRHHELVCFHQHTWDSGWNLQPQGFYQRYCCFIPTKVPSTNGLIQGLTFTILPASSVTDSWSSIEQIDKISTCGTTVFPTTIWRSV